MNDGLNFKLDNKAGEILREWWAGLENNKGDRAALQRCGEPLEAAFVPAYHWLFYKLSEQFSAEKGRKLRERILCVAPLVAAVKWQGGQDSGSGKSLPVQMASPLKGRQSAVSDLRFRRLLQCQSRDDLFPHLRRVIRLLDKRVDIYHLADDVYWWGDHRKRDWAHDYYQT